MEVKFVVMDAIDSLGEEYGAIGVFDTPDLAHKYIDDYEKDLGIPVSGMWIEEVRYNPKYK